MEAMMGWYELAKVLHVLGVDRTGASSSGRQRDALVTSGAEAHP
jgi:hypothetical protein